MKLHYKCRNCNKQFTQSAHSGYHRRADGPQFGLVSTDPQPLLSFHKCVAHLLYHGLGELIAVEEEPE